MKDPIWISRGETQRRLGVSSTTLARLIEEGRISSLLTPGVARRVYSASDVNRLVEAGTIPAKRELELVGA